MARLIFGKDVRCTDAFTPGQLFAVGSVVLDVYYSTFFL
jgi:hypothetical protein